MYFFDLHFTITRAADAAGMKHDTASKWIKRGELVLKLADREKVGRGGGVILTARTTLQLILAAELHRRGLKVPDACEAALNFAHFGDIEGEMGATRTRQPGHLHSDGITLLIIDRVHPDRSKVRHFTGSETLENFRTNLDAVDIEALFWMRLGSLFYDGEPEGAVHAAMADIKG